MFRMIRNDAHTYRSYLQLGAVTALLAYPQLAHAYLGESLVQGMFTFVLLPVMFLSLLISAGAFMVSPQHLKPALYSLIGSIVFSAFVYGGDKIMGWLTSAARGG